MNNTQMLLKEVNKEFKEFRKGVGLKMRKKVISKRILKKERIILKLRLNRGSGIV